MEIGTITLGRMGMNMVRLLTVDAGTRGGVQQSDFGEKAVTKADA